MTADDSSGSAELVPIQKLDAATRPGATDDGHQDATPPNIGTLAWLQQQPHVDWTELSIPQCHRVPEGAELHPEQDGRCRVIRPGDDRCRAPATRSYGICLVHAGGGGGHDMPEMRRRSAEVRARLKTRRQLLAVGPSRAADPRQLLRLEAHERAETIADAMLAPLDDEALGSLAKQGAALRVLDAAFPIQTVSVELELPTDAASVSGLGWQEMQQLAAALTDPER